MKLKIDKTCLILFVLLILSLFFNSIDSLYSILKKDREFIELFFKIIEILILIVTSLVALIKADEYIENKRKEIDLQRMDMLLSLLFQLQEIGVALQDENNNGSKLREQFQILQSRISYIIFSYGDNLTISLYINLLDNFKTKENIDTLKPLVTFNILLLYIKYKTLGISSKLYYLKETYMDYDKRKEDIEKCVKDILKEHELPIFFNDIIV